MRISVCFIKNNVHIILKRLLRILKSRHLQTDEYGQMSKDFYYESTERYPRSIQVFSSDTQTSSLHPTRKPLTLLEFLVNNYTNEGEIVLDNFLDQELQLWLV